MSRLDDMRKGARRHRDINDIARQSAMAQSGQAQTWEWLPIDAIVIDDTVQVRVDGLDAETVEQYAVIMFEHGDWGPFPPVDVYYDRERESYLLSAGFHRMAAAALASQWLVTDDKEAITLVKAAPRPGGYDAALEHAEQDNLANALKLSMRDKQNIFFRRLERGHDWLQASDRSIASEIGVSHKTIGNWRRKFEEEHGGENYTVASRARARVGADGRVYDVKNVRDASKDRAVTPVTDESDLDDIQRDGLKAARALTKAARLLTKLGDKEAEYVGQLAHEVLRFYVGVDEGGR